MIKFTIPAPLLTVATIGWCLSSSLHAQSDPDLLLYEGFDYDPGSRLEYLDGGHGWAGPWGWRMNFGGGGQRVEGGAVIEPGSLGFGDLAVRGNHVRLSGELGELQLGRGFASAVGGEPGTSTYISYLGQRVGPPANPADPAYGGDYAWGDNLFPRGASLRFWNAGSERLSIGNFSNQELDEWAIYGSGLPLVHTGVSFSAEPRFVVVRVDHREVGAGDDIYMWIDPEPGAPEDAAAAVLRLEGVSENPIGPFTWISPFAGHASTDSRMRILRPHAEMLADEIRVGRTYASVTPTEWNWAHFLQHDEDWVDTGRFMGWLQVAEDGWVWSTALEAWVYLPADRVSAEGAWVLFVNTDAASATAEDGQPQWEGFPVDEDGWTDTGAFVRELDVSRAPFAWSDRLGTWIYVPEGYLANHVYGYAFVYDYNERELELPGKPLAPVPADLDQHVDVDSGSVELSWSPGQRAIRYRVYYGVDAEAVAHASPADPGYLGETDETSIRLEGEFYSMERSYWRVDSVNDDGVTPGDVWSFRPRQLAFPGAEGYGRFALGGRHGQVVKVTNLNDSGPGSLRAAIEDGEGPRIIVFDVGGLITLESHITIRDKDNEVTIAGQTAPYPGITLRKHKLGVSGGNDVVVRFLRLRLGNLADQTSDGTGMQGSENSIMDHLSISWSIDEGFSSRSARNITLQNTIIAEALNEAGHKNYPAGSQHGYAASVGGDVGSFHHNLLVHNAGRNWSMAGGNPGGVYGGRLDFTNNVVYNWRGRTTDGGAHEVNFVNNYYQGGPSTTRLHFINPQHEKLGSGTQRYFVEGNVLDVVPIPGENTRAKYVGPENQSDGYTTDREFPDAYVDEPFFPNFVTTQSADEARKRVLSSVGANQPAVDPHDWRYVTETLERGFTYRGSRTNYPGLIDSQDDLDDPWGFYVASARPEGFDTDGDGLPDWFEAIVGTDPRSPEGDHSDMRLDPDGDGFTLMDEYLAWLAAPHIELAAGATAEVDLGALTRGFVDAPAYRIDSAGGVDVTLDGGAAMATVRAVTSAPALASFTFTVTDGDGHTMTRTVGIYIHE